MNTGTTVDFFSELIKNTPLKPTCPNGYYSEWKENVFGRTMPDRFRRMFEAGNGRELQKGGKACAVHSSSMLAYNFFHWISNETPLVFRNLKFVDVAFEVKLRCLKNRPAKANLDVALIDKVGHHVLFLESKFTEHFHLHKFIASESYEQADNYVENGSFWSRCVKKHNGKTGKYYEGIKQSICHLVAIDRLGKDQTFPCSFSNIKLAADTKFQFATLVFEPNRKFKKERKRFDDYKTLFQNFADEVEKNHVHSSLFEGGFFTYGDIWQAAKHSMPSDLQSWLSNRYMKVSASTT